MHPSTYSVIKPNQILLLSLILISPMLICAERESGYFKPTSLITIQDTIWELNSTKEITFRTCSESGNLLTMKESFLSNSSSPPTPVPSSNSQELALRIRKSQVEFSWSVNGRYGAVQIGRNVSNNKWYTVSLKQILTSLELKLFRSSDLVGDVMVVGNWTFNSYLLSVRLSGSLKIGEGFSGCLYQGPGAMFTSTGYTATDVSWDTCPLTGKHGCSKEDQDGDDCYKMPCLNKGTCIDGINSYTCVCPPNFNGTRCENNLAAMYGCRIQPCLHHGVCLDITSMIGVKFTCMCHAAYTGLYCEIARDLCGTNPCGEGTCSSDDDNYRCDCTGTGFTGAKCNEDINECENSSICRGFPCYNRPGGFSCICSPGFDGEFCQEVNECTTSSCENGGTCIDGINEYTCLCLSGYTGTKCEVNIDECTSSPCQHGGTCHDRVNSFTCSCAPGYTGAVCEVDINECASKPCTSPNMVCVDKIDGYLCLCKEGFSGADCSVNINDCLGIHCAYGGTCIDGINDYTCSCTSDYMGKNCTEVYNACKLRPCLNRATCGTRPPQHEFTCYCLPGFTGSKCEVNIDDCVAHNCSDFQVCSDGIDTYSCGCPRGYTGPRCESKIGKCEENPCLNNGTCEPHGDSYKCHCVNEYMNLTTIPEHRGDFLTGYTGTNCEQDIDECAYTNPPICQQGGLCENSPPGGFTCYCRNFQGNLTYGLLCQEKGRYCDVRHEGQECQNGGTCVNLVVGFKCQCAPGFRGRYCEDDADDCLSCGKDVDPCLFRPCQNNGTCVVELDGYRCSCAEGFNGTNCEMNIDHCSPNPCLNGGVCQDHVNNFTCDCKNTGFHGRTCEVDINLCAVGTCLNGGTCVDGLKNFTCLCQPGYEGARCELDIPDCIPNPCAYDGLCEEYSNKSLYDKGDKHFINFTYEKAAGYLCTCPLGLQGANCTEDLDECQRNLCQHNSVCINMFRDGFTCKCSQGYKGRLCEVEINECNLYTPCKNGGTCVDLIANYRCICPKPAANKLSYGGRNCTTALTGCDGPQRCLHGACTPSLFPGLEYVHAFECHCFPGFSGGLCDESSLMSFNSSGESYLMIPVGPANFELSLRFQTTVPNGVLVLWKLSSNASLSVELRNGKVFMQYKDNSYYQNWTLNTVSSVNNSAYHQLNLKITNMIQLDLPNETCTSQRSSSPGCKASASFRESQPHNGTQVFIGRDADLKDVDLKLASSFVGCVNDVVINGKTYYRGSQPGQHLVSSGCPRVTQCVKDSCSGRGFCEDRWDSYACHCNKPYHGINCENGKQTKETGGQGANVSALPLNNTGSNLW